jgi:hypothetical protein
MTIGISREYHDAFNRYVKTYGRAAKCVTFAPITTPRIDFRHPGRTYTVALAQMDPVRCAGKAEIRLRAITTFRVLWDDRNGTNTFSAVEQTYFYDIAVGLQSDNEVIGFHWPGEAVKLVRAIHGRPHLHLGALVNARKNASAELTDFHKLHIPTGHVTFPMVVRFLIEELGVDPINPNWERVLAETTPE